MSRILNKYHKLQKCSFWFGILYGIYLTIYCFIVILGYLAHNLLEQDPNSNINPKSEVNDNAETGPNFTQTINTIFSFAKILFSVLFSILLPHLLIWLIGFDVVSDIITPEDTSNNAQDTNLPDNIPDTTQDTIAPDTPNDTPNDTPDDVTVVGDRDIITERIKAARFKILELIESIKGE